MWSLTNGFYGWYRARITHNIPLFDIILKHAYLITLYRTNRLSAWHLCKLYTCLSKFKFNKRIFSFCSMTGRTFQRSWYGTTVQCSFPIEYQEVSQLLLPVFVFHFICRYFSNANCIALCDLKKKHPRGVFFWICISNFYHCCRNGKKIKCLHIDI